MLSRKVTLCVGDFYFTGKFKRVVFGLIVVAGLRARYFGVLGELAGLVALMRRLFLDLGIHGGGLLRLGLFLFWFEFWFVADV